MTDPTTPSNPDGGVRDAGGPTDASLPGGVLEMPDAAQPTNSATTQCPLQLADLHLRIIDSCDNRPIGLANVSISGPEDRANTTDAQGNVLFEGIQPGTYYVDASHTHNRNASSSVSVAAGGSQTAQLTIPCPPCNRAEITMPKGSLTAGSNPTAAWLTSPCHHFDFQGVVSGAPRPYVLQLTGRIAPSMYACQWSLDAAAGTLTNPTNSAPTHMAPASAGEGTLTLTGALGGSLASCTDNKRIKIYRDHLARDYENFGTGISCGNPRLSSSWTFTRFGATISMPSIWNCHGGTSHIYNGVGSGRLRPSGVAHLLDPARLKKTVTVTHTDLGGGSHPPLGSLSRGDIVAYYTAAGSLAHTQTCTGNGNETYGANNLPVRFPGRPGVDEAWQWATSPAGDWANNIKRNLFSGATPFTIKVFSRP